MTETLSNAARFMSLFAGLDRSHGTYTVPADAVPDAEGKLKGKAVTIPTGPSLELWEKHLDGTQSLGVVPIQGDSTCVWGCLDVDSYVDFDLQALLEKSRNGLNLPLVICRSKSGGAHCFLFAAEPVTANLMRARLAECRDALGLPPKTEIFPKQEALTEQNASGGWLNMPYHGTAPDYGRRYSIMPWGVCQTPEDFLNFADISKLDASWFAKPVVYMTPGGKKKAKPAAKPEPAYKNGLKDAHYPELQSALAYYIGINGPPEKLSDGDIDLRILSMLDTAGVNDLAKRREYIQELTRFGYKIRDKDQANPPKKKKAPDQTAELLKLCDDFTYVHDAGPMREPYVLVDGKTLGESEIGDILTDRYHAKTGRAPNAAALKASVDTIRVLCRKGPAKKTYIRFANFRDAVYWDLCNDAGEVIKITAEKITIIKDPPVVFRRTGKTLPLVAPGSTAVPFKKLADILNVDDLQLTLIEAWCLSCFQPGGDLPILALLGEHGSIKTSVIEKLMSLLNPSKVPHCGLPETEKDCVVGARNAGVVAYDNVSGMSPMISDISCRIATGAGISTHTFYETVGETFLTVQVPQIFSGIGFITRADFADRCVTVTLTSLAAAGRKRKRKVLVISAFTDLLPGLVRHMCETVQKGLKNLEATEEQIDEETNLPRMADFASWAAACLGYGFLADYKTMSSERGRAILEDDQVARALITWLNRIVLTSRAVGMNTTMGDLLAALNEVIAGQPVDWSTWPKVPEKLSMRLMRLAPNLREEHGITFTKLERTKAGQPWSISWPGVQIVLPEIAADGERLTAADDRYRKKAA